MKKDLKTQLIKRKIKKPSYPLISMFMAAFKVINKMYKVDFTYDYDPKQLKEGPIILLSSHASRIEFMYTI